MTTRQKVAAKHVNVVDRVIEDPLSTRVPSAFGITRVDRVEADPIYARVKRPRTISTVFDTWNDITLGDLVKSGLLGE